MDLTIMAKDAVQHLEWKIPAASFPLYSVEEADAQHIVLETADAMVLADVWKVTFTVMSEWGVADVMPQGDSFDEVFVKFQETADIACDFG